MSKIPSPKAVAMLQTTAVEGEIKRVIDVISKEILAANLKVSTTIPIKLDVEPHLRSIVVEKAGTELNAAGWSAKADLNELTGEVVFTVKSGKS